MFRSRFFQFASALFILAFLAFLWAPILWLYAPALSGVLQAEPSRLFQALPISPLARALFWNTLFLCFGTAILSLVLGGIVASFLSQLSNRFRYFAVLFALPLSVSPTLMATAYLEISRTPPARAAASLGAESTLSINSIFIAAPVLALCFYPIVAFALGAVRRAIPNELLDAARLCGESWSVARGVLWPLLAPAAWASAGIVAALAMWEMGAPDLLDVRTYSVQIYRDFSAAQNIQQAALDALPMLFLGALCFLPAWRALSFYRRMETVSSGATKNDKSSAVSFFGAILILIFSPLAPLLVFVSQMQPRSVLGKVWQVNQEEIWNTLVVATSASFLIVCLSLCAAALCREYSRPAQRALVLLFLAPLLCAPIMMAIAILNFFNLDFWNQPTFDFLLDSRYGLLLLGLLARFAPLGVLQMHEAIGRIPKNYVEAGTGLGAAPLRVFTSISTRLLAPQTLGLFAVCWALCASELSLSVLLNAPGGQTLPVPIFNQMHIGATAEVGALSLILVAMSAGVLFSILAFSTLRWFRFRDS